MILPKLLVLLLVLANTPASFGLGGEIRKYELFNEAERHRQNLCERYELFRAGLVSLRDGLSGMELHPLIFADQYFRYNDEDGIDQEYPGLLAELLDLLALRANFTWRDSFGVFDEDDMNDNKVVFTDALVWGTETYDFVATWSATNTDRMSKGINFFLPWYDSSPILIRKTTPPVQSEKFNYFGFLAPFQLDVWLVSLATVIVSALVFQCIEYLDGEREDRSIWQWMSDNMYLSSLNAVQNFEYAPNSGAGRLFGVSMAIWGLVMGATYTANLATFLVAKNSPVIAGSIEESIEKELAICTESGLSVANFVLTKYPTAKVVRTDTFLESYQLLNERVCDLVADQKSRFFNVQENEEFNPDCDLEWVGRAMDKHRGENGFARRADHSGHLCTGFLEDVMNIHFAELSDEGHLEALWAKHRAFISDGHCATDEDSGQRRLRLANKGTASTSRNQRRQLKSSQGTTTTETEEVSGDGEVALSFSELAGTFILHWGLMAIALVISTLSSLSRKWKWNCGRGQLLEKKTTRPHGPVVGAPPPVNTWTKKKKTSGDDSQSHAGAPQAPSADTDDLMDHSISSHFVDEGHRKSAVRAYHGTLHYNKKRAMMIQDDLPSRKSQGQELEEVKEAQRAQGQKLEEQGQMLKDILLVLQGTQDEGKKQCSSFVYI